MILSNKISDEIKRIYPDIKTYLADRYANKYVSVVLKEIRQAILRPINKDNELSFSKDPITRNCGRIKQTNEYLFDMLQRSSHTRLVDIVYTGNLGKLSRVVLNPIYKDQIMHELMAMPIQALTDQERKEIRERANRVIEIDTASLSSFIQHTEQKAKLSGPGKYYDKLANNLLRARELYLEHQNINGKSYLMEYWEQADTGREYGHYNSLQRMSQEVRHAALGDCHKYDFQAHSFAVMASIAKTIDPDIKIAQIEDYIRYRTVIRERIAKEVGVNNEAIKSVFTSLGFGAKPVNNPYTSIRRAVYTEEAYKRLIDQTEFKFIVEDLETINNTIDATLPTEDFVWHLGMTYHQHTDKGRLRTRSQRLAWLYQNTEAYMIKWFIDLVRERTGLEPVMTVHDCVYYKQKLPANTVIDAQVIIRADYPYIRIEHQAIYPIGTEQQYNNRFADDEEQEQKHQQCMREEEQQACGYKNQHMQALAVAWDPITELQHRQQIHSQSDYVEYSYELESFTTQRT